MCVRVCVCMRARVYARMCSLHAGEIEIVIDHDLGFFDAQFPGEIPGGGPGALGRAGQDQVRLVALRGHALAHVRRVALAALVQRSVAIGQRWVFPRRLGMAHQVEDLPVSIHTHEVKFRTLKVVIHLS